MKRALIVVDVQQGFHDLDYWGVRNNPACEANIERLMTAWRQAGQPIVRVIHDSEQPGSPLAPGSPGHEIMTQAGGAVDLEVHKTVHSAFHGTPDLATWLDRNGVASIAVCGITTNMCCETTARVGSDLGYDLWFVLDGTHGFDLPAVDGSVVTAAQLAATTAAVIEADFGRVVTTDTATAELSPPGPGA